MIDPLGSFDWEKLYAMYDAKCAQSGRFSHSVQALSAFSPKPDSDRSLYYGILSRVDGERRSGTLMSLGAYESIIYWKLYSTCGDKFNRDIHNKTRVLHELMRSLPQFNRYPARIRQGKKAVLSLVTQTLNLKPYAMKLPVCTAVLHFLYPEIVPIFDKMVLMAVGYSRCDIDKHNLNQDQQLYGRYSAHVRSLTARYAKQIRAQRFKESPVRIIDMALWLTR